MKTQIMNQSIISLSFVVTVNNNCISDCRVQGVLIS